MLKWMTYLLGWLISLFFQGGWCLRVLKTGVRSGEVYYGQRKCAAVLYGYVADISRCKKLRANKL